MSDNLSDTLPMQSKSITFTEDDAGEKKFSKGTVFKKPGKQNIYVYDLDGGLDGEVSVEVEEAQNEVI